MMFGLSLLLCLLLGEVKKDLLLVLTSNPMLVI